jgi:hypothetical protein
MIKFYQRRKRRQRLNRLGWITLWLAVTVVMIATIASISIQYP